MQRRDSLDNTSTQIDLIGSPNHVLLANGGKFNNKLLRNMSYHLNILIRSTVGESPWSNGITKTHNVY